MKKFIDIILYEVDDKVKIKNRSNNEMYMEQFDFDLTIEHTVTEVNMIKPKLGSEYQIIKLDDKLTFPSSHVEPTDPADLAQYRKLEQQYSKLSPKQAGRVKTKTSTKSKAVKSVVTKGFLDGLKSK